MHHNNETSVFFDYRMVNTFVPDIRDGQRELYESNESKATYFSYNFNIILIIDVLGS